jgi:integrase
VNFPQYSYLENYEDKKKVRYIEFLAELGNNICFEDDTWICDKRIRSASDPKSYSHIYFSAVPQKYKEIVKYFAIIRLLRGNVIRTVRSSIIKVTSFIKFLVEKHTLLLLSECNVSTAIDFKNYLDFRRYTEQNKSGIWRESSTFLTIIDGFNGVKYKNPFTINPYLLSVKHDYKIIPDDVASSFDKLFKQEEIELHIRCIYWMLRLIPSRISEVLGMKIDCVKAYNSNYVVFIPTWKQNGGNMEPILRSVHLEHVGVAGYLLELLLKQQKVAEKLQKHLPEDKQGYLFSYQRVLNYKKGGKSQNGIANVIIISFVRYHFKRICEAYDIKGEDGKIYNLTSHQFRHNGITDRLAAGFTLEQIADMTGHHGNAMIWNAYSHLDLKPKTIIKKQNCVLKEPEKSNNNYVMFNGRILNMEGMLEKRLLKNIRAHRVLGGICGDVTGCKNDMWNCLSCEYFIPEVEQFAYFEDQITTWKEKAIQFENMPIIRSNAIKNAKLFQLVVNKIRLENKGDE